MAKNIVLAEKSSSSKKLVYQKKEIKKHKALTWENNLKFLIINKISQ